MKYRDNILGGNLSDYNEMRKELLTMMDWNIANGEKPVIRWDEAMTMMPVGRADPYERYIKRVKLGTPTEFIKAWSKK